jgi:predicted O-methyltransferase YrrM
MSFKGVKYRLADNWIKIVNIKDYENKKINYLEIGCYYGANIISVEQTYGKHKDSRLYGVDPWEDYAEYTEYKNTQENTYQTFSENIKNSGNKEKFIAKRGYSNEVIPTFSDNFFDIIYIDGNHEPDYVLEDAVLCFRKLKKGGLMIFDDYGWGGPDLTKAGIDGFLRGFHKKIEVLGPPVNTQVFLRKN